MKIYLFATLLLSIILLGIKASAQTTVSPGPGYVVTLNDDTLRGEVTTIFTNEFGDAYVSIMLGDSRERPYPIKNVKVLVWKDARYLPVQSPFAKNGKNKKVFMRAIMENASSAVLEYEGTNEDGFLYYYYLTNNDAMIGELTKKTYSAYITQYFTNCEDFLDAFAVAKYNDFSYKEMHEIALLYTQKCK